MQNIGYYLTTVDKQQLCRSSLLSAPWRENHLYHTSRFLFFYVKLLVAYVSRLHWCWTEIILSTDWHVQILTLFLTRKVFKAQRIVQRFVPKRHLVSASFISHWRKNALDAPPYIKKTLRSLLGPCFMDVVCTRSNHNFIAYFYLFFIYFFFLIFQ